MVEAVEEEVQRMAVEVVEGVQEEGEVLKHRQGLMVGGVVVEVQVVPRHGPVGLASRPAERLPASLARKQRSLPAQDLEGSPQRQGQLQREKGEHWAWMRELRQEGCLEEEKPVIHSVRVRRGEAAAAVAAAVVVAAAVAAEVALLALR